MPIKIRIAVGFWLFALGMMSEVHAATKHALTYSWSFYYRTSKVRDVTGSSLEVARINCERLLADQTVAGTYSCKTPVTTDVVMIVPDPPSTIPPVTPPPTNPPPISTGSVTLSWTPPTQNTDGSTLYDLAGYTIRYGTTAANLDKSVNLTGTGLTAYVMQSLAMGSAWYFAIETVNAAGVHSQPSSIVSKTL